MYFHSPCISLTVVLVHPSSTYTINSIMYCYYFCFKDQLYFKEIKNQTKYTVYLFTDSPFWCPSQLWEDSHFYLISFSFSTNSLYIPYSASLLVMNSLTFCQKSLHSIFNFESYFCLVQNLLDIEQLLFFFFVFQHFEDFTSLPSDINSL